VNDMAPSGERDNSGERKGNNTSNDDREDRREDRRGGDREDRDRRDRDRGGDRRGGDRDEKNEELATRSLRVQSKRYYIDVKENQRGRFLKLVEGLPNGNKNRITFPMSTVPDVRDKLTDFAKYVEEMETNGEKSEDAADADDGRLKTDDIRSGQRRVYFDLKENKRGVFLRISSAVSYGPNRQTVALPAEGILDVRNVLTEMIEEFGQTDEQPEELPEFQELRVEKKRFYFDCGSNDRGSFVRISEVTNRYRSSITIPKEGLAKFKDILGEVCTKLEK